MSPSDGGRSRLTRRFTRRPLNTTRVPLSMQSGMLTPSMAATSPAQAPAALITTSAATLRSLPPRPMTASKPPSMRRILRTGLWFSTVAPWRRAELTLPSARKNGSMDASGTLTAALIPASRQGSISRASLVSISSALIPALPQAGRKRSTYSASSLLAETNRPPVSSMQNRAMRLSTAPSSAHSLAETGSVTAYLAPLWSMPWLAPVAPAAKSPASTSMTSAPLMARSLAMPVPVAPPPMMSASTLERIGLQARSLLILFHAHRSPRYGRAASPAPAFSPAPASPC